MKEAALYAVINLAGAAAGVRAGRALARACGGRLLIAVGGAFCVFAIIALCWMLGGAGPALSWAVFASGFLFVALSGQHCRKGLSRLLFVALATLLGGWLALHSAGTVLAGWMIRREAASLSPVPRDGVALQSTFFSCLPAAAATCMTRLGVGATEAELADAAQTTFSGTMMWRMACVLDGKLAGTPWRARLGMRGWEDLPRDGTPAILDVVTFRRFPHVSALLGFEGQSALVGDPLEGAVRRLSRGELEAVWSGKGIWFEREEAAR